MKNFLVTYMASSSIDIEANTEAEAREKFNAMLNDPMGEGYNLMEQLDQSGIELTDIFEEK